MFDAFRLQLQTSFIYTHLDVFADVTRRHLVASGLFWLCLIYMWIIQSYSTFLQDAELFTHCIYPGKLCSMFILFSFFFTLLHTCTVPHIYRRSVFMASLKVTLFFFPRAYKRRRVPSLTSQQHLVQQVVYLGQAAELNELELFDHLPGDALQGGQQE